MNHNRRWLTGFIIMATVVLFSVIGLLGSAQSNDTDDHERNEGEMTGESNSGGEEDGTAYTLSETYDDVRGGVRLILAYDAAGNSFNGTVENITQDILAQVRVEVHLSNGVELGPTTPTDLAPGEQADVTLDANNIFDSWSAHAEVGAGEEHLETADGACSESGERSERGDDEDEEDGTAYALSETYDDVRGGARLILAYDATSNSFSGTVENTTGVMLEQVRVEVHLSNGVELGPTASLDLEPGEQVEVMLDANNIFETWSAHAEVGANDEHIEPADDECGEGGEHGNREGRGEHGRERGENEGRGEHGRERGENEDRGEHGRERGDSD